MLVYLLKSVACLAILFVFYKVFLEKENMHVFKRFFLLGSLVLSMIIPTLVFTEYVEATPVVAPVLETTYSAVPQTSNSESLINVPPALASDVTDIAPLLWIVYFIGLFFFGLKFLRNLVQIFQRIRKNPKHKLNRFTQVLLQETIPPHTFFSYIFLNKTKLESDEIPKEVLLHEETHAQQKHSYDVVLVEFLQVIFWVNPLVYFFKKAIKLNHEFLADQAVLKKNIDKATYQNTLLSYLSPDSEKKYQPKLANAINYSSIKKRFTVMKTRTSKKAIYLRTLLLLPLMAILLYGFSETKVIETTTIPTNQVIQKAIDNQMEIPSDSQINSNQKGATNEQVLQFNSLAKKYNKQPRESRIVPAKDLRVIEDIYGKMSEKQKANAQPFPECPQMDKPMQDGASRKLMEEYDKLAKHYNEMPRNNMKIKKKDVDRLEHIYSLMSEKQKADAEPFPDFPPMPDPPAAPKAPKAPKTLNEREEAAVIIEKIIEEQDPYNVVGGNMRLTQTSKHELQEQRALKELLTRDKDAELIEVRKKMMKQEAKLREQEIAVEQEEIKLEKQEIQMQVEEEKLKEQEAKMQEIEEKLQVPTPPLPPEPVSPLDHVIEMAKKDATFYYEGKEISSDKAIELLKKNDALNIDSRGSRTKSPVVRISKQPIIIEN